MKPSSVKLHVCAPVARRLLAVLLLLVSAFGAAAVWGQDQTEPEGRPLPWQRPYTGASATGPTVVALWHFDQGAETVDASGHGHTLTLRGRSRFVAKGKFGGCLESFGPGQDKNTAQGAVCKNSPDLTPAGPFTLELWVQPKPELSQRPTAFLLDKKYLHYPRKGRRANSDYCLYLRRAGQQKWRLVAYLGYGEDSAEYASDAFELVPGRWYHVAFSYDGAGTGRFFLNGRPVGRVRHEGRGSVAPGPYDLVIGDRFGSLYAGFPGYIDEVRISNGVVPYFAGRVELTASLSRTSFVRMEPKACLWLDVVNDSPAPLTDARLTLSGEVVLQREVDVGKVEPGRSKRLVLPVDTSLRPDRYPVTARLTGRNGDRRVAAELSLTVALVPRPKPFQMPVVMWGRGDLQTVKEIGFTHQLVALVDYGRVWQAGQPTQAVDPSRLREAVEMLNEYLAEGVGAVVNLSPRRWVLQDENRKARYQRIDRQGKPYARTDICARFPELQRFAYNVGASVAQTFGRFPALQAALIDTEVRDATNLCFHPHDVEAFRRFAGFDVPSEAVSKRGVDYTRLPDFPANRVLPDNDPLLTFYRWFWKVGDGWNEMHSQLHRGLKSTGRDDLWTFFDPAVRVPSLWGSGGEVDVVSQWTYTYPDPIKIGQACDELFAMADGKAGRQRVMKMTQIIWYRSQTAPKLPDDPARRADWEKTIPDARFITIAPDHLREAFWSKISRPVAGIMYHGWGSLVPAPHGSYRFTNPKTRQVLSELIRRVVRPLGPTLLQVPDRPSDVAVLESFTSQMFARRGTWGWSNRWEADVHLILQWAHLQPRILYDETIQRDGLEGVRVLVLPYCDVLTESVVRAVKQFQQRGGIVVADETLCPAIEPDIRMQSYQRTGKADEDKAALQAKAAELRQALDPLYRRHVDSSQPDLVVRCRQYGRSDYVFVLNDRRTFGDYVGHHGRVMEKGLPLEGTVTVRQPGAAVYDLVAHRPVPASPQKDGVAFDVTLGPGAGGVFLVTPQRIDRVELEVPRQALLGQAVPVELRVVDPDGQPLDAVVPVRLEVLDPQGRPAEPTGYYGAASGRLKLKLELARNDVPGRWTVRATELASGRKTERTLTVRAAVAR